MCLGIVGQVIALCGQHPELATVDVAGAPRDINIMMLAADALRSGDWILIHAGFAIAKIDEENAREQIAALREYTGGPPGIGEEQE